MWKNHTSITWRNIALLSLRKELVSLQPFHCSLYAEELKQGACEWLMHWGRGSWSQADNKHRPIFPGFTFVMAAQHWLMTFIFLRLYLSEYWLNQPSPTWCSPDMLNYGSNYPRHWHWLCWQEVMEIVDEHIWRNQIVEDWMKTFASRTREFWQLLFHLLPTPNSRRFHLVCLEEQKSLLLKRTDCA